MLQLKKCLAKYTRHFEVARIGEISNFDLAEDNLHSLSFLNSFLIKYGTGKKNNNHSVRL
jgi:hypothetical protein